MKTQPVHPALLRTTNAFADIGARQEARSLPVLAQTIAVLGLQLGAIAAIMFG